MKYMDTVGFAYSDGFGMQYLVLGVSETIRPLIRAIQDRRIRRDPEESYGQDGAPFPGGIGSMRINDMDENYENVDRRIRIDAAESDGRE